jgi:hypothetical protein
VPDLGEAVHQATPKEIAIAIALTLPEKDISRVVPTNFAELPSWIGISVPHAGGLIRFRK